MIIFIILGFVSCIFQLVLVREFTFSIAKNELALIAGVGIWALFCALAALTRKRRQILSDTGLMIALPLSFGIGIILAHTLKILFGIPYYESVSGVFSLFAAVVVLGPTGAVSGYAFSHLSAHHAQRLADKDHSLGHLFACEALGVFLGGIVFTLGLYVYQNPLSFTALPLLMVPALKISRRPKAVIAVTLMLLSVSLTNSFPAILQKEFAASSIIFTQGSAQGPIILTDDGHARSLYVNGSLIATSEDKEAHEAFIHTALATHAGARDMLWIGPCLRSQVQELEKYPLLAVTAVDSNPRPRHLPSFYAPGKNITFKDQDPRSFLNNDPALYDLIVLNIPAPSALIFNRFYTVEFFQEAKKRLKPQGNLIFKIPSKADILSPAIRDFNACIIRSLQRAFPQVFLIPGDTMIVAASQQEITAQEILKRFERGQISAQFMTVFHLRDMLDPARAAYIQRMLSSPSGINTDLMPYGFLYYTLMDQARFTTRARVDPLALKPIIFLVSLALIGSVAFVFLGRPTLWLKSQAAVLGSLSMSASAVIFFCFQLLFGGLFWKLGILVGVFMAGLAAGSFFLSRAISSRVVTKHYGAGLFLVWLIFFLEIFFWANYRGHSAWHQTIWMLLAFENGLLTGFGYPLLSALWRQDNTFAVEKITPALYAADLLGACAATLLASMILIPFLGINLTCLIVFAVIIVLGLKDIL